MKKIVSIMVVNSLFLIMNACNLDSDFSAKRTHQDDSTQEKSPVDQFASEIPIEITGEVRGAGDISAVTTCYGYVLIGSDEATGINEDEDVVQLLSDQDGNLAVDLTLPLTTGETEMDIEGIACGDDGFYVIGSHSAKRKKVKAKRTYQENHALFQGEKVVFEPTRQQLFKVEWGASGDILKTSLKDLINLNSVLSPWSQIPSKENGLDIEGLAFRDGNLYAGFRGPVFRNNYVPVLKFQFTDQPESSPNELLYVQLGGLGIRDMVAVGDGFLILAGPVGDGQQAQMIYLWNGKDMIPGKGGPSDPGMVKALKTLSIPSHLKAEGLALMNESPDFYQLLLAYDGAKNQGEIMESLVVRKP